MRNVWKYYFSSTEGIIFVIDASDKERLGDAKEELLSIMEESKSVPLLIYANKQDVEGSLGHDAVVDEFGLHDNSKLNPKATVHI